MTQEGLLKKWLDIHHFERDVSQLINEALMQQQRISTTEFYFLHYLQLKSTDDISLARMRKCLNLSPSAVSRMAIRLETNCDGIIERYRLADNKKDIFVRLTAKGQVFYQECSAIVTTVLEKEF